MSKHIAEGSMAKLKPFKVRDRKRKYAPEDWKEQVRNSFKHRGGRRMNEQLSR